VTLLEYIEKNKFTISINEVIKLIENIQDDDEKINTVIALLKRRNIPIRYIHSIFQTISDEDKKIELGKRIGIDLVTLISSLSLDKQKQEIDLAVAEGLITSSEIRDIIYFKSSLDIKEELLNSYINILEPGDIVEIIAKLISDNKYAGINGNSYYINLLNRYMETSPSENIANAIAKILDVLPELGYELINKYINRLNSNDLSILIACIKDSQVKLQFLNEQAKNLESKHIAEIIKSFHYKSVEGIIEQYIDRLEHSDIATIISRSR